ncbi:MAG: LPS assembly protein LptD [Mailhella sp.]|nr:LPS assembly protein LptD [Mailhella sp.]
MSFPIYDKFFSILRSIGLQALALCMLFCASAWAGEQKTLSTPPEDVPWTLFSDKMVSLDDGVIVEASGNVLIQHGKDYLKADFARYYTTTDWIFLKGHVEVRMDRDMLSAQEAEFDIKSQTGWLKEGSVFIAGPHMYVAGEKVDKITGSRYLFRNAKVTACDGDNPAWSLSVKTADVEIDGYARLSHSRLNILDVPVADAPYMLLPVKTTRQSGLLLPDMGYSSTHGVFWSQPYYQVIDDSRDLTFYGTYMARQGFMPGLEYRAHTRDGDKTWLGLDFIHDRHTFLSESGDRINPRDERILDQKERFWLRGMGDGYIGDSGWRYRYDLDYVSDQNFLREFRHMKSGFNNSRDSLYDMFGRDIQEADHNRISRGFVYREWDRFMLSAGIWYEELPYLGHGNAPHSSDTTVQRIPVSAYLYKGSVWGDLPLEVQAEVSSTYEYRERGVRGLRTEVHPELSLPVPLPGATLLLNGGFRQTWYNASHEHIGDGSRYARGEGRHDRFLPEASVTAFTQLSRTWQMPERRLEETEDNVGSYAWTGVMHRIQPRLSYGWIPDEDQTENPFFEDADRIRPSEIVRLSVANILTAKKSMLKKGKDGSYEHVDSFFDPIRWEIATGYDLEEARRTKFRHQYDRKPLLDTYSYLQFDALDWLSFWDKMYISAYGDGLTRHEIGTTLKHKRWGSWSLSYMKRNEFYNYREEMKRDTLDDMKLATNQKLLTNTFRFTPVSNINIQYQVKHNLITGRTYESDFILGYYHQCFHLIGQIKSKGRDESYRLILEIPGLNF